MIQKCVCFAVLALISNNTIQLSIINWNKSKYKIGTGSNI